MTWDIPALAKSIVDGVVKIMPDRDLQIKGEQARDVMQHETELLLAKLQAEQLSQQAEINKVEAANPNWWVSGWRPYIGWIAGTGMAWAFIGQPIYVCAYATFMHEAPPIPAVDAASMMTVLMGMLGFGLRTFEKAKGVAK